MPKSYGQKLKLLYLEKILCDHSDESHPIPTKKLIEMLDAQGISCERKAIYDDIECLRSFGHDIIKVDGKNGGYAMTNLRKGHIVAIVDHRVQDGERQVLIIDSSRDCMHYNVRVDIREVVIGSEIYAEYVNRRGVRCGEGQYYAMYWVPISKCSDFNLLHKI